MSRQPTVSTMPALENRLPGPPATKSARLLVGTAIAIACCHSATLADDSDAPGEPGTTSGPADAAHQATPTTPSRLVSDSELEHYVRQITGMLPIMERARDPFGVVQDPDAEPEVVPVEDDEPAPFTPASPAIPLSEVVSRMEITTVMPGEGRFLVGTRSFHVGNVFPVNYRGRTYRLRVEDVTMERIRFRNTETDESAEHSLNPIPDGMRAANGQTEIPGLIPSGRDAPIDLD